MGDHSLLLLCLLGSLLKLNTICLTSLLFLFRLQHSGADPSRSHQHRHQTGQLLWEAGGRQLPRWVWLFVCLCQRNSVLLSFNASEFQVFLGRIGFLGSYLIGQCPYPPAWPWTPPPDRVTRSCRGRLLVKEGKTVFIRQRKLSFVPSVYGGKEERRWSIWSWRSVLVGKANGVSAPEKDKWGSNRC